jgi:hypothetical protein
LAALRIDLVGTTADLRRFGPPYSLPRNDLLCENRGTAGRIGEVGLCAAVSAKVLGQRQGRFGFGHEAAHDLGDRQDFLDRARRLPGW